MEVNKLDQYALNKLHAIRELVKHDPKLQILSPSACKCIRKLRIHRQRVRGKWAGRTRRLDVKQTGVNLNNLVQMPTKNVSIDRSKHLTLVVCNTQSIKNKDTLLLDHLVNVKSDLCLITETWLSNSDDAWIATSDIMCNGYKLSNVNRNQRRGGGLALAYKNNLNVKLSLHGQSHSFEYAVWECNISNMLLTLVGIYHPPYSDVTKVTDAMFLDDLAEFLETMLTTYSNIIVSGDFNLHIDDISNPDTQVFLDLMTVLGYRTMFTLKHILVVIH